MKAKKTLTVLTVAALGASSLMGFAACGHEHDYVWTENPLATCVEDGKETGKCKICGEETERVVPASNDRHAYGDWAITEPTAEAAGKAVKQCSLNAAHKLEVTLPALNGEGGVPLIRLPKSARPRSSRRARRNTFTRIPRVTLPSM